MNFQHKTDNRTCFRLRLVFAIIALVLISVTSQQTRANEYQRGCQNSPNILSVLVGDEAFMIEGENFVENDMTMLIVKLGKEDITPICSIVSETAIDCLLPDVPNTGGDFKLTVSLVGERGKNKNKCLDSWNLTIGATGSPELVTCPCFSAFDVLAIFPGEVGCIRDARPPDFIQLTDGLQNSVVTRSSSYHCNGKNGRNSDITEAEMRACVVNLLQVYGECPAY
ncbi:MAG: hypothetical protein COA76_00390 [Moritella sp.]|uniref:IPT/TIG domain-containing protein n=1 Tax=Moritella sp. PE36 TaxID=58051 RepID=UPI0001568F0F|nr:IPT/TIG domain-containing protein [Moritella sp. PE36]EDM65625.1 hypothetical protein PE36_13399 [Moritella sp. PE36]PHR90164.1 MAG: hypothetical protein COA76_00390 [Moritella sp.]